MKRENDLFGMTFEQQINATGGAIDGKEITPNRRIVGEIVLEPMGSGVRVTARDGEHRLLWGYVGSKETVRQIHCLVATYETLQNLIAGELEKRGLLKGDSEEPMLAAERALCELENTVKWLRDSLAVKKVSDATRERARMLARVVSDADRQISLEAGTMKGMKSKNEDSTSGQNS